jgi:hypothetical protein
VSGPEVAKEESIQAVQDRQGIDIPLPEMIEGEDDRERFRKEVLENKSL